MARQGISVDFAGIFDLQETFKNLGDEVYKQAVLNALGASKDYVNEEILKAMNASPYHFDAGTGYSKGDAKKSLTEIEKRDVEIRGDQAIAYAGVSYHDAPELWYIAVGAPHTPKDENIHNAVRVKGKVLQRVQEIQRDEFNKVIEEALNRG